MKLNHLFATALATTGMMSVVVSISPKALSQNVIAETVSKSQSALDVMTGDSDEGTFTNLINAYAVAWSSEDGTLDVDAVRVLYAEDPDLVFYDAILPERFVGFEDMRQSGEELFANLKMMKLTPTGDLDIRRYGDDLAWTTTVMNLDAQTNDGKKIAFPMRQTAIWQRRGSSWTMIHEHVSAPIGTGTSNSENRE
ncbi:YybH family protein [Acaryochloris thomasi]|nr:nuclear transport factor 2 family protein [Acaryochloris thomasi]